MSQHSNFVAGVNGFDIIGDVHGCAHTLIELLQRLGYKQEDGVFKHPSRKIVFVGDIIDRGPRVREALRIVRAMVENNQAKCILGNHEYNAVAYTSEVTPLNDTSEAEYLRAHDSRNNRQIRETLIQFASYPEEWRSYLEWFKSLPVFVEFNDFRVVHACWDNSSVKVLQQYGSEEETRLADIMPALLAKDESA